MVRKAGTFTAWLTRKLLRDPEGLLSLLIEAHNKDQDRADISRAFRAGLRVGLKYPPAARAVLGEAEWNI